MSKHHPAPLGKLATAHAFATALTFVAGLLPSAGLMGAAEPAKSAAPVTLPVAAERRLFGGQVAEKVRLTATVEKINYETREVTLKKETGELQTITAGPEVKRLAEIHPGDTIEIVTAASATVLAGDAAGAPAREDNVDIQRAPKTHPPGGSVVATTRVRATVMAIDYKARTATLKGPQNTVNIVVDPGIAKIDQVKVGDSVYLEITQSIAVAVTKSAPAK